MNDGLLNPLKIACARSFGQIRWIGETGDHKGKLEQRHRRRRKSAAIDSHRVSLVTLTPARADRPFMDNCCNG